MEHNCAMLSWTLQSKVKSMMNKLKGYFLQDVEFMQNDNNCHKSCFPQDVEFS